MFMIEIHNYSNLFYLNTIILKLNSMKYVSFVKKVLEDTETCGFL